MKRAPVVLAVFALFAATATPAAGATAQQAISCSGTFGPTVNYQFNCNTAIQGFVLKTNRPITESIPLDGYFCTQDDPTTLACYATVASTGGRGVVAIQGQTFETCAGLTVSITPILPDGFHGPAFALAPTGPCVGTQPPPTGQKQKPGCGPKKTNGLNPSGQHTGQPPKDDPPRSHCPKPKPSAKK